MGDSEAAELIVVNCGQLITLAGSDRPRVGPELRELAIQLNAALAVGAGRVIGTGSWEEIKHFAGPNSQVVDAAGQVVMPGFIDAHTHFVFAGSRAEEFERRALGETYQSIAAGGGGIRSTVRMTRAASEGELFASAKRRSAWLIRTGTTTAEAKSGYGLSLESELKILKVIRRLQQVGPLRLIPTFLGAHEYPDEFRDKKASYVQLLINEMLPAVARERLAEFADIFCEPHVFENTTARLIMTAAKSHGFRLRLHVDQLSNSGGAELAASLGAVTADHLEQTGASGIAALRSANVQPVLLPGSVYALGSRKYPDARQMIDAGLALVLATDLNPGSSPTPSIPMIISLAVTQMKLSVSEAITATTINAAHSLGIGQESGSLQVDKRADFVIHECSDYRDLGYIFGVETADQVFVGGSRVYTRASIDQY
jgi:imidazolonepropionase